MTVNPRALLHDTIALEEVSTSLLNVSEELSTGDRQSAARQLATRRRPSAGSKRDLGTCRGSFNRFSSAAGIRKPAPWQPSRAFGEEGKGGSMRRKAIMVDVDGVLVTHPNAGGWSANLENDLGIPPVLLHDGFFRRHWADVVHGRAALRDRLALALAEIAPSVSPAALIEYWFENDAHIDARLLAELQHLRKAGFALHLATVQEHERAAYLWDRLALRDSFDGIHYAASLGCSKPDHAFYRAVEAAVQIPPAAIFFIDDKIENVGAAKECGWAAALWTGSSTVRELMQVMQWEYR